ncbi:peptide/nickel transport system permease protein [Roseovarius litoreus]|jgi:peptide/nickel transport system permease protein|uniref:Peptide/nickel transport system permease protein n=1 Tax=Roseovarius litoreus TaxID=1155722 RepID=A0A1M7G209_9RHOB|nr:ABC transporter permease [Roseovarius litoreus]SHM09967.1 peptide/nickel transport system permease protein [Roseovarius litoreus]
MSIFVIGYYTLLLAASCLAAYFNKRTWFLLVFSLTLVSFILGIVGGASMLRGVAIAAGMLALSAMVAYAFREFLIAIASNDMAKELRTAPLTAAFGMFVIFTYAIAGIFAPWIAPFGEAEVISTAFAAPDGDMLLGADQLGRDMFSRIIYGARNTVALALAGTVMAFLLGALAGLLAATTGGWFDQVLGRTSDVIMSIPSLIFALLMLSIFGGALANSTTSFWLMFGFAMVTGLLVVVAKAENNVLSWLVGLAILVGVSAAFSLGMLTIFNPSEVILILVVGVIYSPRVFRLTRAVAGNVVVMDYIEAAKLRGEGKWYLIRREILPNSTAPLIAEFGLEFCFVFLLVAGLSFLGLGIQPPTADWGSMVRENATLISFGDITPLIPAAAIALLTVAVNFVVDWMLHRSSGLKD